MISFLFMYKEYHDKIIKNINMANCKLCIYFSYSKQVTIAFPWHLSGFISQALKGYMGKWFSEGMMAIICSINLNSKGKKREIKKEKRDEKEKRWKERKKGWRKDGRKTRICWIVMLSWPLCKVLSIYHFT